MADPRPVASADWTQEEVSARDWRSRALARGYLPQEIEGLSEEDLESLLDYEDGSTAEGCVERLSKMTIWNDDTASEVIAAMLAQPLDGGSAGSGMMNQPRLGPRPASSVDPKEPDSSAEHDAQRDHSTRDVEGLGGPRRGLV